jgi:hypothetical protein
MPCCRPVRGPLPALLTVLLLAQPLAAQRAPAGQDARMAVFVVQDASVATALRRIDASSRSWRAALDSVAVRGGSIVVATVRELTGVPEQFARAELAEAVPLPAPDSTVSTVMVVVNRELLDRMYAAAGGSRQERDADLMRILIHEIYGHAVPYLVAGHVRGACPDPVERGGRGCSINRENIVRAELRLGFRRSYDMNGLALSSYVILRP